MQGLRGSSGDGKRDTTGGTLRWVCGYCLLLGGCLLFLFLGPAQARTAVLLIVLLILRVVFFLPCPCL